MNNERVNNIVQIDKDIANKLIRAYKPEYSVEEIERFTGGKSTSNYKLKIEGLDLELVLKIYPRNNDVCEKEFAIFNKVREYVPVSHIYYVNTEKTIIDKNYCIMEYLDGTTLDEYIEKGNRFSEELAEEIGEKLALIHQTEYDMEGLLDNKLNLTEGLPQILTWYEYFLNGKAGKRLEMSTINKINKFLENNNKLLLQMTNRSVLAHGDFRPANLMIKEDKLIGILDWEFSLSVPCYFDIGQFLRVEKYVSNEVKSSFIKGYNNIAKYPVTELWYKLAKLMDLANLLSLLDSEEDKPNLHSSMKKLIDDSLKYLINA